MNQKRNVAEKRKIKMTTNKFLCSKCGLMYVTILSVFENGKSYWLCEKCYAEKFPSMEKRK